MRSLFLGVALFALVGCFPGHCDGAFRALRSNGEVFGEAQTKIAATESFTLAADFEQATPEQLLAHSKVSAQSFFVVGPSGRVDAEVSAQSFTGAHSCANAASFKLTPKAPLAPGEYTVVLLLDEVAWPSIDDDHLATWEGKRALVRHYRVE